MKADLHYHGAIGFQPYWLKLQGYSGINLAEAIISEAERKNIGLIGLISEDFEIPKGDLERDRFSRMLHDIKKLNDYDFGAWDDAALIVRGKNSPIIILNGQTVVVNDGGRRYDHLVLGSNQVPNSRNLADTMRYCKEN